MDNKLLSIEVKGEMEILVSIESLKTRLLNKILSAPINTFFINDINFTMFVFPELFEP